MERFKSWTAIDTKVKGNMLYYHMRETACSKLLAFVFCPLVLYNDKAPSQRALVLRLCDLLFSPGCKISSTVVFLDEVVPMR